MFVHDRFWAFFLGFQVSLWGFWDSGYPRVFHEPTVAVEFRVQGLGFGV